MTYSLSLRVASRLDHVWLLRAAVAGVLQQGDIPEEESALLLVALSELVNNSIEHGYGEDASGTVELRIQLEGQHLTLDIFDDAAPMPSGVLQSLLSDSDGMDDASEMWSVRGHGLQIIRQIADEVWASRVEGRNHVGLYKHFAAATAS